MMQHIHVSESMCVCVDVGMRAFVCVCTDD